MACRCDCAIMRTLFVIILLAALVLPSGHVCASPPIDISAEELQMLQTQAAQGHTQAQTTLGHLYENGLGVPQDYAKARQWYENAAAQGDAGARYQLGGLYLGAKGVPRDPVRTYMWWNLASVHSTGDLSKVAADHRERIARHMTSAQIAKAQQRSQQCQAQQIKGC